jgi:hypothetical protein
MFLFLGFLHTLLWIETIHLFGGNQSGVLPVAAILLQWADLSKCSIAW